MLKHSSVNVAVNLAAIAKDRNVRVRVVPGSLMSELTSSVIGAYQIQYHRQSNGLVPVCGNTHEENLVYDLVNASEGSRVSAKNGQMEYAGSQHDALMDNFSQKLKELSTGYLTYARTVVYGQMTEFLSEIQLPDTTSPVQPEDLFCVHYLTKHPVYDMGMLDSEVRIFTDQSLYMTEPVFNSRPALENILIGEFTDKFTKHADGEEDLISAWMVQLGEGNVRKYISMDSAQASAVLYKHEMADYHLFNFLLFRTMLKDDGLAAQTNANLTLTQISVLAASSRDYHAQQLFLAMKARESYRTAQYVISPDSYGAYSYLNKKPIDVFLIEENMQLATEKGVTLEHVFGYIAKFGMDNVDIDTLVNMADVLSSAWQTQRGLYMTYLLQNKMSVTKTKMSHAIRRLVDSEVYQKSIQDVATDVIGHQTVTLAKADKAIDQLTQKDLDDLRRCAMEIVAGVLHRHTNAKEIISRMFDLMDKRTDMDVSEAAAVSVALLVTDFLLAQLQLS